jgi:hypothetical protein
MYDENLVYHQYPVRKVSLHGDRFRLSIAVEQAVTGERMRTFMYLRPGENVWVVHARMLPEIAGKEVVKLCSRYFQTRPLPQWISRQLLKKSEWKQALWYRGERRPYRNRFVRFFSPNAYPMALLPRATVLLWDVRCSIESIKKP